MKRKVCVVGLGYIGLPTAALLASKGHQVIGVDVNQNAIDTINSGQIHIVEPDLDAFVHSAVSQGNLRADLVPQAADVFIIAVPTPFHEGGPIPRPNIDIVINATQSIAPYVRPGNLVILESTSPVGTTQRIAEELRALGVDPEALFIAYCPERVLPGKIMTELVENDRVVGGLTPEASRIVADFYRSFVRGDVLETEAACAEMCKLTENSFRDVNIAFANELSMICDKKGIDVWKVIALANRHPRVNILQPGAGVGGHCIAVDPWFIVASDPENARLIRTAREVNDHKSEWVVNKIKASAQGWRAARDAEPKIVCLGLAFKPDIDDLRESPALEIALNLQSQGYNVIAVEPNIDTHEALELVSLEDAMQEDALFVLLVKHRQFLRAEMSAALKAKGAMDFCGASN
ncbi:UDP-N-acetyl-D-mannosamine dehydrogenase [Pararhizobium sp.]|uniref:UDP-N-acetyl-D-mannosamine dehydrogenase n=1 Tax=Pararhizobium sp. TaxID=1977563 RepID=UPI002717C85D|nr:UDP-N-acetyl-D-mannosamine dehydrogenase [Pararhizobium sp.]MDO9418359.1 UDP-N-acetyl-D-mannosamine dehydrogenase [Pararhizobium sp.]